MRILALISTLVTFGPLLQLVQGYYFLGNMVRDLEGDGSDFIFDTYFWEVKHEHILSSSVYSQCDNTYILGGPQVRSNSDLALSKTYYNLPPHDILYFSFEAWLIDAWETSSALIVLATRKEFAAGVFLLQHELDFLYNKCGAPEFKDLDRLRVYGALKHNDSFLDFSVTRRNPFLSTQLNYFGIRDLTILFRNATDEEKTQKNKICGLASIPLHLNQCLCSEGEYSSSDGLCKPCDPLCRTCLGPSQSQCFECKEHAYFDGNACKQRKQAEFDVLEGKNMITRLNNL